MLNPNVGQVTTFMDINHMLIILLWIATQFYTCNVISRSFWPEVEESMLPIPESITTAQKRIEKYYKKAFPRRSLQVIRNQGSIEIEIEVRGECQSFSCSPLEYQVLQAFCSNRMFFMMMWLITM